ncbi:MAG: hypothetical protein EOO89_17445 [Pedobacter sp.]|nr:MAG: hypothetical protein EOO89_17445 [Pedobacter sp.]
MTDKLKAAVSSTNATAIREAFAADPERFDKYHAWYQDLLFDFSKTAVNEPIRMAIILQMLLSSTAFPYFRNGALSARKTRYSIWRAGLITRTGGEEM